MKRHWGYALLVTILLMPSLKMCAQAASASEKPPGQKAAGQAGAVAAVIDSWHQAAAEAKEDLYFSHFAKDGVFLGTDGTERWTRDEFRAWAKPYFARGRAWTFTSVRRFVSFSEDQKTAWFDEELKTQNMGPCRGSGVLVRKGGEWKIAQYNLSIPIPNAIVDDVVKRIAGQGLVSSP